MMLKINNTDVKSDMLTTSSNVREVLRALYFYGPDYIMIKMGGRERLVHKEQLVSLLELGKASSTIEDIMSTSLNEPMSARMQLEDIPQDTILLVFVQKGSGKAGDLSRMTFEEYRESAIKESAMSLPDWWGVPLPLLFMDEERVALNEQGVLLMPCDATALAKQVERMARDRIITIKEKKRERTFSLRPLDEKIFLIEDISGDFEMAEELVWWAAVGKAFYRRLEENGAVIRRLSPFEKLPEDSVDVIPCSWEGELVGSVVIGIPGEETQSVPSEPTADQTGEGDAPQIENPIIESPIKEDVPDSSPEPAPDAAMPVPSPEPESDAVTQAPKEDHPESKPVRRKRAERKTAAKTKAKPKTVSERKRADASEKAEKATNAKKRGRKPKSETSAESVPDIGETLNIEAEENLGIIGIDESFDTPDPGNLARLNKNAARKAYGGMTTRRATSGDEKKING
jgi:hypothetical protein